MTIRKLVGTLENKGPYIDQTTGHWFYWNGTKYVDSGYPYAIKPVISFKIENGQVTTPLRDVSLSGNILETLNNFSAVGSDFKMSVGFCGKSGQTVPVGDGGPHIKIMDAMVGGAM